MRPGLDGISTPRMRSPDSVTAPEGPQCATAHIFAVQDAIFPSYDPPSARSDDLRPRTQEQVASLFFTTTLWQHPYGSIPMSRQSEKVIISCALTGGIHTPTMSPALPVSPD